MAAARHTVPRWGLLLFRPRCSDCPLQIVTLFAPLGAQSLQLLQVNLRLFDVARKQVSLANIFVRTFVIGVEG